MAVWRDLDDLKLWERNYNKGDVQQIKKSILRFGFNNALRVWRESTVMAGNHSTIALRECLADGWAATEDGIKLASGKLLRGGAVRVENGRVQVDTVDLAHLPKSEAEAFAIADNHIASKAEPDNTLLGELFTDLKLEDMSFFDDMGYSLEQVDTLLDALTPATMDDWSSALGGLATGDRAPFQQMTFTLHDEQAEQVKQALQKAKDMGAFVDSPNENGNGNALARVCELFLGMEVERG